MLGPWRRRASVVTISTITKLLITREFQEARTGAASSDPREGIRWL
jgi:hypothetical protein